MIWTKEYATEVIGKIEGAGHDDAGEFLRALWQASEQIRSAVGDLDAIDGTMVITDLATEAALSAIDAALVAESDFYLAKIERASILEVPAS